jgi:hypothetical protein
MSYVVQKDVKDLHNIDIQSKKTKAHVNLLYPTPYSFKKQSSRPVRHHSGGFGHSAVKAVHTNACFV